MLERARALRGAATEPERILWGQLRSRRLLNFKFRRQVPFGPYILDFYCHAARLAIEVDGAEHADRYDYDDRRTAWLAGQGVEVLRFGTARILGRMTDVLEAIAQSLPTPAPQSPEPTPPTSQTTPPPGQPTGRP
ncbi:MAG: DUF559 domain-containing protein [Pseudomonadota bacterium]|nr:DUF559 domain-containing protein [Pseudomonadota bacterium]